MPTALELNVQIGDLLTSQDEAGKISLSRVHGVGFTKIGEAPEIEGIWVQQFDGSQFEEERTFVPNEQDGWTSVTRQDDKSGQIFKKLAFRAPHLL